MARTAKAKEEVITIPAINVKKAIITIKGTTSLIVHAWDEKTKQEMLDKQMKKAKTKGYDAKDPARLFINSLYWLNGKPTEETEEGFVEALKNGARFGFPATAVKAAAVAAGYRAGVTKDKVSMNAAFHIDSEFIEIKGEPHIREDMVRVGMGAADIRYRGEFDEWSSTFEVRYNAGAISLEQIVNLINLGGFACGIGEWRPEKGGQHGQFEVVPCEMIQ